MRLRIAFIFAVAATAAFLPSLLSGALAGPPDLGADDHFEETTIENWWSIQDDGIEIIWYDGSIDPALDEEGEEFLAGELLDAAWQARAKWEWLLDVDVPHDIYIYVYQDWETLALNTGNDPEESYIAGFIYGDDADTIYVHSDGGYVFPSDTVRHEMGHIVLQEAVWSDARGQYGELPLWLDEGIAQMGEYFSQFTDFSLVDYRQWLADGGEMPPVCAMLDYPEWEDNEIGVDQFYGKSLVLLGMLMAEGGTDKLADLISRLSRGWAVRYALNGTYGFTDHGLEERWLAFAGIDAIAERCTY